MTEKKQPLIKPLAGKLAAIREQGEPDVLLGEVTLHPIHQSESLVWLAGVLIHEGKPVANLSLNALPISMFPTTPPPGRPPETAKHKAVLLSWLINFERMGRKRGIADELTQKRFNYSAPDKVRKIRNEEKGWDDTDRLIYRMDDPGQEGWAALIEKPTFMFCENRLEVLGIGWSWHESWGQQAIYGALRGEANIEKASVEPIEEMLDKGGPITFVTY